MRWLIRPQADDTVCPVEELEELATYITEKMDAYIRSEIGRGGTGMSPRVFSMWQRRVLSLLAEGVIEIGPDHDLRIMQSRRP